MRLLRLLLFSALLPALSNAAVGQSWPQFRGPGGAGVSTEAHALPDQIGPDRNVVWQVAMPPGVSSPVVLGDRLYLTAVRGRDRLVTLGVDATNGRILWEAAAPLGKLERTDRRPPGRLATPTPAVDERHVIVFFGSSGLLCYDIDGGLKWHRKLGPFQNSRGATSSPILVGEKVLLVEDHETGSFIAAFDRETGRTVWRTERLLFNRSYGTPVVWKVEGRSLVVAVGSGLATAYDLADGKPAFFVQGASCVANPTPVVGDDGTLYIASANPGSARNGSTSPTLPNWSPAKTKTATAA